MFRKTLVLAVALAMGLAAAATFAEDGAALKKKGMEAWQNRLDLKQALIAAQTLERAARALPKDPEVAEYAVRSWYWIGINAEDIPKKQEYHMKGYKLGSELQKVQPKNVATYYWASSNISRYAQTLSSLRQKTYVTKIKPLMDKVEELDPTYFYYGLNRYLAIMTVQMSPTLRKVASTTRDDFDFTLPEAEKLIKESIKKEPRYLLNHTTLAEIYIAMDKKAEAKKVLEYVLKADAGALPSEKPENIFEQKRAKEMMAELK